MLAEETVNILLVDDQPAKLLELRGDPRRAGRKPDQGEFGQRGAASSCSRTMSAIVLIDVCMPDLDGFELAAMIREHPRFQKTAIIFVSAIQVTDLDLLRGYAAGAVDYVPVPVVPDLLRAKVRVFAELYRKTRQLEVLNAELERRVAERTAELARANVELEQRVEERTREREAALAQVHEMQKLESLGQLTGGVAHDFNNLLMAVLGNLELLRKIVSGDPQGLPPDRRRHPGRRARRDLDEAHACLRPPAGIEARAGRRAELVDSMIELLRPLARALHLRSPPISPATLPPTRVDPNQLELALLNLALNARDAMPLGGQLTISAHSASGSRPARSRDCGRASMSASPNATRVTAWTRRR